MRYLAQYYIKLKSYAANCIKSWYKHYVQALRLPAKEVDLTQIFLNTDMGDYHRFVHTPEQNMLIERFWRTIGESAIEMLLTCKSK